MRFDVIVQRCRCDDHSIALQLIISVLQQEKWGLESQVFPIILTVIGIDLSLW